MPAQFDYDTSGNTSLIFATTVLLLYVVGGTINRVRKLFDKKGSHFPTPWHLTMKVDEEVDEDCKCDACLNKADFAKMQLRREGAFAKLYRKLPSFRLVITVCGLNFPAPSSTSWRLLPLCSFSEKLLLLNKKRRFLIHTPLCSWARFENPPVNNTHTLKSASVKDIKKKYRELSLQYHPDKNVGNPEAEEMFIRITKAYDS
jgi:hypothetical protein